MQLTLTPLLLTVLLAVGTAWGQPTLQVAGVDVPDHVLVQGKRLVLNGAGLRSLWGFRVYVAALYLPRPSQDAAEVVGQDVPRSLQLSLLHRVSAEQNLETLKAGLQDNNSPEAMREIASEVGHFLDLLRQARQAQAGTRIRLDYAPGMGTALMVDGRHLGTIPGEAFNHALLKIWLGPEPVQLSLKRALLGEALSL